MGRIGFAVIIALAALSAGVGGAHAAWTESVIGRLGDAEGGYEPGQGLMMDKAGNLYGVTTDGGPANAGTVFKLSPPVAGKTEWVKTTLYDFGLRRDDSTPVGALIMDPEGNLYGATEYGGIPGKGTVYKLTPPAGGGSSPWT